MKQTLNIDSKTITIEIPDGYELDIDNSKSKLLSK